MGQAAKVAEPLAVQAVRASRKSISKEAKRVKALIERDGTIASAHAQAKLDRNKPETWNHPVVVTAEGRTQRNRSGRQTMVASGILSGCDEVALSRIESAFRMISGGLMSRAAQFDTARAAAEAGLSERQMDRVREYWAWLDRAKELRIPTFAVIAVAIEDQTLSAIALEWRCGKERVRRCLRDALDLFEEIAGLTSSTRFLPCLTSGPIAR